MRRQINNIISVGYSVIRVCFLKIFHGRNFQSGMIERISPNVVLEFNKGSRVTLGKKIRVHSGSKIKVRSGATLIIGDNTKINYNCMIICRNEISIGEGTEFGPSVYIYDHDHDYKAGLKNDLFKEAPVKIGKNCWIGANTVILKGTVIGDNCVIGAGSVVKGTYEDNSLIYCEREIITKKINYMEA